MDQLIPTNKIFLKNKSIESNSINSPHSSKFNNQMTKHEIKDVILLSLLNNYCQTNNVKDFSKITKEFAKLGLVDRNNIKNYNNDIQEQILNIISEIGIRDKRLPDISVSRINKEYIISDNLGEGAVGTVFKAFNIIDMSDYAIKKVNLESINPISLREVRHLSKLSHENVVRYFSTWIDFDNKKNMTNATNATNATNTRDKNSNLQLYIQMELCDTTLKDILTTNLTKKEKIKLFYEIIKGVEYIHSNNIIHRDIKPSNILIKYVNYKPVPKIADFGLSTLGKDIMFNNNALVEYDSKINNDNMDSDKINHIVETYKQSYTEDIGTELYSSIEQLGSTKYNSYTDIYSLGIIYFELLCTFKNNFHRIDSIQQLRNDEYDWDQFNNPKSDKIFIQKLMDNDITKRPSASYIKSYLEKKHKYCI